MRWTVVDVEVTYPTIIMTNECSIPVTEEERRDGNDATNPAYAESISRSKSGWFVLGRRVSVQRTCADTASFGRHGEAPRVVTSGQAGRFSVVVVTTWKGGRPSHQHIV